MPWFPDFASAVALARKQTRAEGQADPVGQYFKALNEGDARSLETVWPGEVVVYDPRAGEIRGHRELHSSWAGTDPGWQGSTPTPKPWPPPSPTGGPWWSCWPTWTTTAGS